MLPAHTTKHIRDLDVRLGDRTSFRLKQSDAGDTNGTALWLGGQLLSLYFLHLHTTGKFKRAAIKGRLRAIELGSGIGLCGLTLASLGVDVVATDVPLVLPLLRQNIDRNIPGLPVSAGSVLVRELDWTVSLEEWTWKNAACIASHDSSADHDQTADEGCLAPPFDLILTADTLYTSELVAPLLRTLHHLVVLSSVPGKPAPRTFLALERRDPALIEAALIEAADTWGFVCERVPPRKIAKAMEKGGLKWEKADYDGVEVWTLALNAKGSERTPSKVQSA